VRSEGAFLSGFFLHHNVERFMTPLQGHGGGLLYYVPALLLLLSPYGGLLAATLWGARRPGRDPVDTALWCWFGVVFVFFSLASTKLPHYVLYGATPLFVLMARRRTACPNWLAFLAPLLFLAALAALPSALRLATPRIHNPYLREALSQPDVFGGCWQAAAVLLAAAVFGLAMARRRPLWPRLAGAALACACACVTLLLPAVAALQQTPVKEAALLARRNGWPVAAWRINAPSFSVYRRAVTPTLAPGTAPPAGAIVLMRSDALADVNVGRVLYRRGGVLLVRVDGENNHV
jgi:4-amino-4-deoxy-L-arabinose transferase-like glycosyltransferase